MSSRSSRTSRPRSGPPSSPARCLVCIGRPVPSGRGAAAAGPSTAARRAEASTERGGRDAATRPGPWRDVRRAGSLPMGRRRARRRRRLDGDGRSASCPSEPSRIRARAQAALAQHLMIAGRFDDSAADRPSGAPDRRRRGGARRGDGSPSAGTRPAPWAWTSRTSVTRHRAGAPRGGAVIARDAPVGSTTYHAHRRQPHHAARPGLQARGGPGRRPRSACSTRLPAAWLPRTAPSCAATAPTSSITLGAGRRRRPSVAWRWSGV